MKVRFKFFQGLFKVFVSFLVLDRAGFQQIVIRSERTKNFLSYRTRKLLNLNFSGEKVVKQQREDLKNDKAVFEPISRFAFYQSCQILHDIAYTG